MLVLSFILIIWLGGALFRYRISPDALEPFSSTSTIPVRGILAIMIILHHFHTLYASEFPWLEQAGFWGVPICTIFFFFSGYGLSASYLCNGKDYLHNFMSNRLHKLFIPIIIVVVLHLLILALTGRFDIATLLSGLSHGIPILPHLWFVCALVIFYAIFYISIKSTHLFEVGIVLIIFCTIIYAIIIKLLGWGEIWSASIHGFSLGAILASQEKNFSKLFDIHPTRLMAFFVVFTLLVNAYCIFGNVGLLRFPAWGTMFCWMLPVVVYALCRLRPITSSKLLTYLGNISLEIYLVHVSVMLFMRSLIANSLLFFVVTLVITILLAAIFRNFVNFYRKWSKDA